MQLIRVKNMEEASQRVYEIFKEQLTSKKDSTLGLATGSSPIRLYELLSKSKSLDFSLVKTFNLDEYFGLSPEHPQSYHYFMFDHLFNHINIDPGNVHVPSGVGDIQSVCDQYNEMLKDNPIDLQLLGMGGNGHIGFNEPGTSFDSVTHYIELDQRTRQDNARLFFDGNIDEVPTHAITMGIANIMAAKRIVMIICGKSKAEALKKMLEEEPSVQLPASALMSHPDCIIFADDQACSLLTK